MRGLIQILVAASLISALAPSSSAQPPRRYQDRGDARYHQFGRGTLDRVRADLARAQRNLSYVNPIEMRRFQRVREGLADFQRKWEHGRYDRSDLDQAIGNLAALIERGRLRPPDRGMLAGDLRHLREMQYRIERGPGGPRR